MLNHSLLNNTVYTQRRYDLLLKVEEHGDPKEQPYADSVGIPTLGIGFNLREQGVRNSVLKAFGINPNTSNLAELGYIAEINGVVSQSYRAGSQAARNTTLRRH